MRGGLALFGLLLALPFAARAEGDGSCAPDPLVPAIEAVGDAVHGAANAGCDRWHKLQVPAAQQTRTLQAILDRVSAVSAARAADPAKPKPVVEIDLDLTSLMPIQRTIDALKATGVARNIPELTNPQALAWISGYTEAGTFDDFLARTGMKANHPGMDWNAVYWDFRGRYWGGDLGSDVLTPGLADFKRKVEAAGGVVVFISGRVFSRVDGSDTALGRLGQPYNLVIKGRDMNGGSDAETKANAQPVIRSRFGEPVAILDDRATNRDAVLAALGTPIISEPVHIPGFSQEPDHSDPQFALSTFELAPACP
jgi:hypothetical protein